VIGADTAYISHGEIQTGLAEDSHRWAADLARLYADDFAGLGDERDLLLARNPDGSVAGLAVVAWEATSRRAFAVLEDMVVDPDLRSAGLGARIVEEIEAAVRQRGIGWLFLESGLRNARAHAFFERQGFETLSHVFAKQLD
jgi:GNAT superfamily N-acetyltransferase